jgi:cation transport ATPase
MMFSTSSLYFLVAIYGESIETNEVHGLQLVHGEGEEVTEPGHNENQEKAQNQVHNESNESVEQRLKEGQEEQVPQNGIEKVPNSEGNESKHIQSIETEETSHEESASEAQRRNLEFPLSIGAGVGYAAIGMWMILDKRNSKIPYIMAIVGSLILLGIYASSRTIGISSLGREHIGLLDAIVAALQVAIIAISLYILIGNTYTKGMTVRK